MVRTRMVSGSFRSEREREGARAFFSKLYSWSEKEMLAEISGQRGSINALNLSVESYIYGQNKKC